MNRTSKVNRILSALTLLVMVAAFAVAEGVSNHTKAVLEGKLTKGADGKGYSIHVEKATDKDGKEIADLKGKDMPLPENLSDAVKKQCGDCCDKVCKIKCDIKDGKIVEVKKVWVPSKKSTTKGGN